MHEYVLNTETSRVHKADAKHVRNQRLGPQWQPLGLLANWTFARIEAELHVPRPKRCSVCPL